MDIAELPSQSGVLICGHGSRASIAEQEFSLLAKGLKKRFPLLKIEYGFLEYSAPNIHMALDKLLSQGVNTIYAVPGMLFAATHAQNDIPSVLTTYQQKHPGLHIEYGKELGLHPYMIQAFQTRILAAMNLQKLPKTGSLYDTLLVVVGRGTSVTNANAEAAKLTRIVCENMGFGWAETVYSGVTFPSVGRGLEMAVKLGFKKIIVAPYFLFGGRLIDRIYAYVDKMASQNPNINFLKAGYLRDQTHVINTFIERINETITGPQHPQTLMQNFQQRLKRGEVTVHHHHAEYQSTTNNNQPTHSHHHHAPYKHIAHPHGPRTMINDNVCCCFMKQFPQEIIDQEKTPKIQNTRTPVCKK